MQSFTHIFNVVLTFGTLITLGVTLLVVYLFFFDTSRYIRYQSTYALRIIMGVSFFAMMASLVYSLVIGFPPCDLCWYQRVFMYGIFFISLTAWCKKDILASVFPYLKTFIGIGFIIALYHTIVYYVGFNPLPCSTDVSCTARYVFEFGFMTIPLMSLVSFAFLGTLVFPTRTQ